MTSGEIALNIVVADADTWLAMYVNDKLHYQDHDVPIEVIIELWKGNLGKVLKFERKEIDFDWLDRVGEFPLNIEEVVFI